MKNVFVWICLLFYCSAYSQLANYPFNSNFSDTVNGLNPTLGGSPIIIMDGSDQVAELEGDEYLEMPNGLHQTIDTNDDFAFSIRFKITDLYDNNTFNGLNGDEGRRVLVSNKYYDQGAKGFELIVRDWDGGYNLIATYGDGITGGQIDFVLEDVQVGTWYDIRVKMVFDLPNPYTEYKINNIVNTTFFEVNEFDFPTFVSSFNTQKIWVGTDRDNDMEDPNSVFAKVHIDRLAFYNPIPPGDVSIVASSLNALIQHMDGTNVLSNTALQNVLADFSNNWDADTYAAITSTIQNYMTAFETNVGTVFSIFDDVLPLSDLSVPQYVQYVMAQSMFDNLYTPANVANMAGVKFSDHTLFPGAVSAAAPRVNGNITINGTYQTNPAFFINDQGFVIRPTGFYAAPGDVVTITVPSSAVNQGLQLQVGAHYVNLGAAWTNFNRFPRVANRFDINTTTFQVANPFGGAMYVVLPDGSQLGAVTIGFQNAVKAPYFSTKVGFETSFADYQIDIANRYVEWADWESDNFMVTFPSVNAATVADPNDVLSLYDQAFEAINLYAGRPITRFRSEYVLVDQQIHNPFTIPASYPMSIAYGFLNQEDIETVPVNILDKYSYFSEYNANTILHEMGHLHGFPTMPEEYETNVDVPASIVYDLVFDMSLDSAQYYSNNVQFLEGDYAMLDWLLDPLFRAGFSMSYEQSSYQSRGAGKYVDIARLFTWDTMGLIHNFWYQEGLNQGMPVDEAFAPSEDEFVLAASNTVDFNMAPLFEIWGTVTSTSVVNQLDGLARENRIKDRIFHYRSLIPRNAVEFAPVANHIRANIEDHYQFRYDDMLNYYDEFVADSILLRIDNILCKYYDVNCDLSSVDVNLEVGAINVLPNPTMDFFEITGMLDAYTITIMDVSGNVIQTLCNKGSSLQIDLSDLPAGLYFINISNNQHSPVCLKKIIKQ